MNFKLRNKYTLDPELALTEILKDRGVKDIDNFLYPTENCELNPYDLDNIKNAADMLLNHLHKNHKILIIIDQDCDGFTSASILWLYIKRIFPQSLLSFTIHEHKQHGLEDKIDWIETQDFDLVIAPDAASFDIDAHKRLDNLGIDCICLDHHTQLYDNDGNPIISNFKNTIVVNNQLSPNYDNKSLCGAGVVYKFCEVLDDLLSIDCAHEYMDLVALGEIADVMDRTNTETNYLMMEGLSFIHNKGFQTLLESQSYSLKEKATFPWTGLTPIDIAFYIAPLINAITRIGTMQEKELLFYCFIEPDKEFQSTKRGAKPGDIETAAEQAARISKNVKARQDKIKEKAIDLIDFKIQKNDLNQNNVIVVEVQPDDNIPQEIGGLVAMSIVNKYNKPCLIVRKDSNNLLQGSARTNNNFKALSNFKSYLENSGFFEYVAGHEGAFGLGIYEKRLPSFLNYVNTNLSDSDFENCYTVDYILDANNDNKNLLFTLASHPEYFGNHIDEIKIIVKNIPLSNVMAMGANKDSMKISCKDVDYIRFKDADFVSEIMSYRTDLLTIYGRVNLNLFAGRVSIQVFIDDYELVSNNKYDF